MIKLSLDKARQFEEHSMASADSERQRFHVSGGIGWINDPNGFSMYKGEYHLFHQYHPFSIQWGPMYWGHLKTKDFIKWDRLPIAIAPEDEFDCDGCFSGSAVELDDGRQLLLYTGVVKKEHEDGTAYEFQHQCVAVGDGINYVKYDKNPVIDFNMIPEDSSKYDFRDPKIWKEDGVYYCVVANRMADDNGAILLYKSEDAFKWEFVKILAACNGEYGTMWECPDFFSLDDKQVMIISPMEMEAEGLEFHGGHGVVAFIGSYDKINYEFTRENVQAVDYGIDFYAPQTTDTYDGRRIMIAWMRNWSTACPPSHLAKLEGAMTIPRELEIKDGRLIQNPVRELINYHVNPIKYNDIMVSEEMSLPNVNGRVLDMTVSVRKLDGNDYNWFKIKVGKGGKYSAEIRYKAETSIVRVDRAKSSGRSDVVHTRNFYVRKQDGDIKFRVIMDGNSVELFVNDGEQAATFLLYSPIDAEGITFEADGNVVINVEKYDICI